MSTQNPPCNELIFFAGSALINQYYGGQWAALASDNTVSTADDVWYHVYVKTSGSHVEVWRRADTETEMTKVLETDSAAVTTGPKLFFDAAPGSVVHYDNIRVRNNDGDIRSFTDDFSDGDYTADPAWTVNGTWSVVDGGGGDYHVVNAVSGGNSGFNFPAQAAPSDDHVISFSYYAEDTQDDNWQVRLWARYNNADGSRVEFQCTPALLKILQWDGSQWTGHGTKAVSLSEETWYEVKVVVDGCRAEMWHREKAPGAAWVHVGTALDMDVVTSDLCKFIIPAGDIIRLDDFVFEADDPETVVYTHNAANELLAMDGPAALARFDYDAWGRTVTKRRVSGAATHRAAYGYRFGQRLKSVQTDIPGEQSADYNYDGLGKRRNKVIDGDATWFRWDAGWNMIAEYDGGVNQLDWDPGDLAMTYVPGLAQVPGTNPATGAYGYLVGDHLGSSRAAYNEQKGLIGAFCYSPYGEPRNWRGFIPSQTYTGHYRDAETGLYSAPFRHYMPDAGLWITRDPLGMVDGTNLYAYIGRDPLNGFDSLGLFTCVPYFSRSLGLYKYLNGHEVRVWLPAEAGGIIKETRTCRYDRQELRQPRELCCRCDGDILGPADLTHIRCEIRDKGKPTWMNSGSSHFTGWDSLVGHTYSAFKYGYRLGMPCPSRIGPITDSTLE